MASTPLSWVRDLIKTNGLGYMDQQDYEVMADLVMKYLANEGDSRPVIDKAMTNRFIGGVKLSTVEWAEAHKNAQEFRPYVT